MEEEIKQLQNKRKNSSVSRKRKQEKREIDDFMKKEETMEYKDIRENLEEMINDNYKDFIKALVSIEKGVNDEKALEEVYVLYMNNDTTGLLSDDFDYMIDDMKEQGKIVENTNELEEKDDLINLVGNIVGKVENLERENANGEKFKVSNFSLVSKDDDGNKVYTNCSAYGDKTKDLENLK